MKRALENTFSHAALIAFLGEEVYYREALAIGLARAAPRALERDWRGLGRDTAFFLGYQVVVAGGLYLLPESVTKWTAEQRKTSMRRWWENVQHPVWDKDHWYVNYLGHP